MSVYGLAMRAMTTLKMRNLCEDNSKRGTILLQARNTRTACTGKSDDSSWIGTGLDSVDDCQWACDGGYDNSQNRNLCETTEAEYYSSAGSNGRTICAGKPADSSWTMATGLVSANECAWVCNGGYDNSQNANLCETTEAGYYSPADSKDRTACAGKPADSSWTMATRLASTDECAWVCNEGYDNSQNANLCETTEAGYYSPADSKDRTACAGKPVDSSWTMATGLTSTDECAWVCNEGYIKKNRTCRVPANGKYADDQNIEKNCSQTINDIENSATIGGQAVVVSSDTQCPFTCQVGYVKSISTRICSVPGNGDYADSKGIEQDCSDADSIANSASVGGQAVKVANSNSCPFTCNETHWKSVNTRTCVLHCEVGYVKDVIGRSCTIPPAGMYADSDGKARLCSKIADGNLKDMDDNPLYAPFEGQYRPGKQSRRMPLCLCKPAQDLPPGKLLESCSSHGFVMRYGVGVYNKDFNGDIVVKSCTPIKYISRWLPSENTN